MCLVTVLYSHTIYTVYRRDLGELKVHRKTEQQISSRPSNDAQEDATPLIIHQANDSQGLMSGMESLDEQVRSNDPFDKGL